MDIFQKLSILLETLHSLTSNSHLVHLCIRISRASTETSRVLSRIDIERDEIVKSCSKLISLLYELIEILGGENNRLNSNVAASSESSMTDLSSQVTTIVDYNKLAGDAHDLIVELQKASSSTNGSLTPELRRKTSNRTEVPTESTVPTLPLSIDSLLALNSQSNLFPSKALADVYTLYCLSTSPSKLLPPGKSLSSLLYSQDISDTEVEDPVNTLEARVRKTVETAYFDGFVASLSSSTTSPQDKTLRWSQLLQDIWLEVSPLIPSKVQEKRSLQSEFTTSLVAETFSISKATATLHHLLSTLAKLIAPVRDTQVRTLLLSISSPLASSSSSPSSSDPALSSFLPSTSLTPKTLVEAVQSILAFIKVVQSDLDQFKRNIIRSTPPTEVELIGLIRSEAIKREREVVELYYKNEGLRVDKELKVWVCSICGIGGDSWEGLNEKEKKRKILDGMMEMVFGEVAVGFSIFNRMDSSSTASSLNTLPPIFIVPSPDIFKLQNKIQALIILACLLSFIPSLSIGIKLNIEQEEEIAERLWIILTFESTEGEETKLINLSDEVISSLKKVRGTSPLDSNKLEQEGKEIKDGVSRILRYDDPIFRLLKNRLLIAMKESLNKNLEAGNQIKEVPTIMRTGRSSQATPELISERGSLGINAKGFERGRKFSQEILVELELIFNWSMKVWSNELK